MEYISHEGFKNLMSKFQKETPKGLLKEAWNPSLEKESGVEEGNAFTAALAKAKKGEKINVGGEEMTDTSNYDDPSVKEYSYTDNYQGSWGYRESKIKENVHGGDPIPPSDIKHLGKHEYSIKRPDGQVVNVSFDDYEIEDIVDPPHGAIGTVIGHDEDGNEYRMEANFVSAGYDDWEKEPDHGSLEVYMITPNNEGLHMPPLQATGPTIVTTENSISNPPMGFAVLSPSEREQLREYISTIKTVQKEIKKLVGKAKGHSMNEAKKEFGSPEQSETVPAEVKPVYQDPTKKPKAGGDRTGLVLKKAEMWEAHGSEVEKIESKIDPKLYQATMKLVVALKQAGLTDAEVGMFIKHQAEEAGHEDVMGQHDIAERSYAVSKNSVPAYTLKKGDMITSGEEIVSVSAGAMTPSGKVEVTLKNPTTGKERTAVWGKHTKIGKKPKAE
jgi:hypothetical protein